MLLLGFKLFVYFLFSHYTHTDPPETLPHSVRLKRRELTREYKEENLIKN